MSVSSSKWPPSQIVEGLRVPAMFSAEVIRSVINYKPRDDDIFIVTYPKCGTTWSHHMLALILRHGEPFGDDFNFFGSGPFLELTGMKVAEAMPRPGAFKTHLPFRLVPWSDKAKYIYVTRNPKDACVSGFHHMKNLPVNAFTGNFDEYFEHFLSGDIDIGDYFDHVLGWYEHRNDPNVMFLTYEEMKENAEAAAFKMASFIDDDKFAEPLRKDRQKLENVLKYSSFKEMKPKINKSMDELFANAEKSEVPDSMKEEILQKKAAEPKSMNFIRKGIVGDWRNHFSEEQSRRLDEKFAKGTQGTEIANWWKEYM